MSLKGIMDLSWIETFLVFGVIKFFFGLLAILYLLAYSGFDLSSMSQSAIEVSGTLVMGHFIAGFIYFGIASVLYLIKKNRGVSHRG